MSENSKKKKKKSKSITVFLSKKWDIFKLLSVQQPKMQKYEFYYH